MTPKRKRMLGLFHRPQTDKLSSAMSPRLPRVSTRDRHEAEFDVMISKVHPTKVISLSKPVRSSVITGAIATYTRTLGSQRQCNDFSPYNGTDLPSVTRNNGFWNISKSPPAKVRPESENIPDIETRTTSTSSGWSSPNGTNSSAGVRAPQSAKDESEKWIGKPRSWFQ